MALTGAALLDALTGSPVRPAESNPEITAEVTLPEISGESTPEITDSSMPSLPEISAEILREMEKLKRKREEDDWLDKKRKAERDAARKARGDMTRHVVKAEHIKERETWRKRGEQNLVVYLNGLVDDEKAALRTAGYLGTEVRFWTGCTGKVTRQAVFCRLDALVAGEARLWRNGYYIGSSMGLEDRWMGWYDKKTGNWIEGHRHRWTGKRARATMEVLAVSEGEAGPNLEREAIMRYYRRHGCANRRPDAAGTTIDAHNFLYFVWW